MERFQAGRIIEAGDGDEEGWDGGADGFAHSPIL
jgi:hypothetical protein